MPRWGVWTGVGAGEEALDARDPAPPMCRRTSRSGPGKPASPGWREMLRFAETLQLDAARTRRIARLYVELKQHGRRFPSPEGAGAP